MAFVAGNKDPYAGDTSQQHESHTAPSGLVYLSSTQIPSGASGPQPTSFGYKSWTFDWPLASLGSQLTDGATILTRVETKGGTTISNTHFVVNAVGSGVTNFTVGIYDSSGARLATSGDVKASLVTGKFTVPLAATVTTDYCYVGVSATASTTDPTFYFWNATNANLGLGTNAWRGASISSAVVPATMASASALTTLLWAAIS